MSKNNKKDSGSDNPQGFDSSGSTLHHYWLAALLLALRESEVQADRILQASSSMAEIVSTTGVDLPGLLSEYPEMESTPEIRIPVPEETKFELMSRISKETDFSPGRVIDIDGVRVDDENGWGLVRASNTMPVLTVRFEANDVDALERIKQQFREQHAKMESGLEQGF